MSLNASQASLRRVREMFARLASVAAIFLASCATLVPPAVAPPQPTTTVPAPAPSTAEPPPPSINLQGFPLPYRQGYADGCASVNGTERKDPGRFKSDGQYRTGWQDGNALCKKR